MLGFSKFLNGINHLIPINFSEVGFYLVLVGRSENRSN